MLTLAMIEAARKRIAPYIYETPLLRLPGLDAALGCQVYVKCEKCKRPTPSSSGAPPTAS